MSRSFTSPRPPSESAVREQLGLKPDTQYIVFVGSAHLRKGIDILIDAFLLVHQVLPEVELLVVGPSDFSHAPEVRDKYGKVIADAQQRIAEAGCTSLVHWVGVVENPQDYMRAANVFCLPTRREGFGIVIAEAMATGLPVVVAKLDGITTDIVRAADEGKLIDDYDPERYAQALLQLLKNPQEAAAIGEMGRKHVESEFDLQTVTRQFATLYLNGNQASN